MDGGHSIPPLCTVDFVSLVAKAEKITVWLTLERNLPKRE